MAIFKNIKNSIVNTTSDISDLTKGFTSLLCEGLIDSKNEIAKDLTNSKDRIVKGFNKIKEHGKTERLKAQTVRIEANKAKIQAKLEKLQAKLETEERN